MHCAIKVYRNNKELNPEKANVALEFISYLIEKKANSNIKDCNDKTPLDTTIFFNAPEIVELLIKVGADLNARKKKSEDVLNYTVTVGHIDIGKTTFDIL